MSIVKRALLTGLALATLTTTAHADPVSPTGKGIAGGALLGGELVVMTEAAFKVKRRWAYILGGTLGAAGGAAGGFVLEDSGQTTISVAMLMGGMALVIPTGIVYLNATASSRSRRRKKDYENQAPSETPVEGEVQLSVDPQAFAPQLTPAAGAVVGVDSSSVRVGVPSVSVSPVYTRAELAQFGVEQHTRVMVPLLAGRF